MCARRPCRRVQARHRRARLQIYLARHPPEIRRRLHLHLRGDAARLDLGTRLSVRRRHRDLHRRMLRRDLAQFRLRPHVVRRDHRGLREGLRPQSRRQRPDVELQAFARLGLAQFQPRAVRALELSQYRAAGRCRRHRAFLGRLRLQAGDGKRDCARQLHQQRAEPRIRVPPLRGRAAAGSAAPAERRAQFDRMVRGRRALSPSRSGAVQLFAAHALAAHQPREPAPARSGLAGRRGEMVRAAGDRAFAQCRAPADVRAVPGARARARQPRLRLADGAIPGGRRHAQRLALRALCRARQRRRRADVHRDDLRVGARAHLAGLHRALQRRARAGLEEAR